MRISGITLALGAALLAPAAHSEENVESLDQRLKVLERKLEIQQDEAEAKARDGVTASAGEKGFSFKKGDFELKLRGLLQADGRFFLHDDRNRFSDTFLLRRLRPSFEGSLGKLLGFRLTAELAGDGTALAASAVDAYIDLKFDPAASVRVGKQKSPVGLERLQSGAAITFVERSFATELVPNRDIGVALFGEALKGTISYTAGIFNGTADGRDISTADADNRHELAARIFAEPFRNSPGFFQNFGVGVGGSFGSQLGTAYLSRYRTPGQNPFFGYVSTAQANGKHYRYSPQLYWYRNAFGLLAEYAASGQAVQLAAPGGEIRHFQNRAYDAIVSWVVTGEDASFRGVKPDRPYTVGGAGWGALEVAARFETLDVDDEAFDAGFANPATAASEATGFGAALIWHLTQNAKVVTDYNQTWFEGGPAANGVDRQTEKAIFTRLQLTY